MPFSIFLHDLALVMVASGAVTLLFRRLQQPVVIGYILVGFLIGPHLTAGLVRDEETIHTLSQLGMLFLMFHLGLELDLGKLREAGTAAVLSTLLEIGCLLGAGYFAGRMFGWSAMDSLFLGALLSISSTTITFKALADLGRAKEKFAQIIFAILIVEDLLAIVLIALLSGIARTGSLDPVSALMDLGRLSAFLATSLVLGYMLVPRLLHYAARFRSDEMLLILVLGLGLGFSLLTIQLGYSVALGAFLVGVVIGKAREHAKIRTLLSPVRDMFSAIFFVSVGLLFQPGLLVRYAWPIVILTGLVTVGKVATCTLGTFLAGHDMHTSTRAGMGKAQIGEFSFIIAGLGLTLGVTSDFLFPVAVSVSVVTALMTPYLIGSADRMTFWFERHSPQVLLSSYNLYTRWSRHFQESMQDTETKRIIRGLAGQLALFYLLIAGALVIALFLSQTVPRFFPYGPAWKSHLDTGLWLMAMLATLPIFVAAFRKMKTLGEILAALGIPERNIRMRNQEIRSIVSNGFLVFASLSLFLWVVLLSSSLLHGPTAAIVLGGLLLLLAYFLREPFHRMYGRCKDALVETLAHRHLEREEGEPGKTAPLAAARLAIITVAQEDPWAGMLIGETRIRARTGASIVGIERKGERLINPGPGEEILAGDRILLLGEDHQLEAVRKISK